MNMDFSSNPAPYYNDSRGDTESVEPGAEKLKLIDPNEKLVSPIHL